MNTPIQYRDDEQAVRALNIIYGNEEEAVNNMIALIDYTGGEPFRVYEVNCYSFYSGRGFIIVEDG
jgi:hypothetical protein